MKTTIKLISISALILISLLGFAKAGPVHVYHLKNGLTLIVKEDHRAPVVISQVWYKVGSSYEQNGTTGISHVLEHMMYKGTPKYPAGKFSKIIAANGGEENAMTNYDFTMYYQKLAANRLPISFKLEADRMQNLAIKESDFKKELQVVQEERRLRFENSPQGATYERFMAAAFLANPYHNPIIGWENDLENMTYLDVNGWYRSWYAPNNAIVVVVGDVKPQKVYQLAEKYFGKIPAHQLPPTKPHRDVKAMGKRFVQVRVPAKLPWLIMGYNVPSLKTTKQAWQPYALDVLAGILDGGDSSRLPQELIRKQQIASDVGADYDFIQRFSGLFLIYATPSHGYTLKQVQEAILEQIKRLQSQLVTKEELQRIKAQVVAQNVYDKDSLFYQAYEIGSLESIGLSWRVADDYVKRVEKVTPQQIQEVARQFLINDRLTVAKLIPIKGKAGKLIQSNPVPVGVTNVH